MSTWPIMPITPITLDDARAAHARIRPYLPATALRRYAELDHVVGHGIRVLVKHENHQPTNAFKVRNALAAMTALEPAQRRRGVIAATRGNHGQGVAWAGRMLGAPVTICVPRGNNPEKNAAVRGLGATLVEDGRDYDESVEVARRLMVEGDLSMIHSTEDAQVIAGAATISLEILAQIEGQDGVRAGIEPGALDAMVIAVGGGSQAVGALAVTRALRPDIAVYGIQAAGAAVIHDAWHAGKPLAYPSADTFADGLATRRCYESTFGALREGLRDFVTVTDAEIADAVRVYLRTTHNLAEGAGAAGLAGLRKLAPVLAGKTVAVILSGANIDQATLRAVLAGDPPAPA